MLGAEEGSSAPFPTRNLCRHCANFARDTKTTGHCKAGFPKSLRLPMKEEMMGNDTRECTSWTEADKDAMDGD